MPQIASVFEKVLLIAVVIDLALGGNGYAIELGPFRIREILFACCVPWAILRLTVLWPVKIDRNILALTFGFVAITALDAGLGYFSGNKPSDIVGELKPFSYFPMLLFFAIAIRSAGDTELIGRLLVISGIALSAAYLLLLAAAYTGIVSYLDIYKLLSRSDEFIFRQAVDLQTVFIGFFYKGMFYVGVAALFLMFGQIRYGRWLAGFCMIALAMTLTRSVVVGLACAVLLGAVLIASWRRAAVMLGLLGLMASITLAVIWAETRLDQREFAALKSAPNASIDFPVAVDLPAAEVRPTDAQRTQDIKFVFGHLDVKSLLIGNGLGAQIGSRDRIELNYLEILYKQGLPGLLFWGWLLGYVGYLYRQAAPYGNPLSLPFVLSVVFVYATTMFNTFLTGSIGMGAVFIALCSLYVLSWGDPGKRQT